MENKIMMPASYNVLSCEEMTYTEGGATFTEALLNWIPPIGWYMGVTAMRNYRKSQRYRRWFSGQCCHRPALTLLIRSVRRDQRPLYPRPFPPERAAGFSSSRNKKSAA